MEAIKCIFCDKDSDHVLITENGYTGRKCPDCGLIYISPRPSIDEIKDLYGHDQANITAESHIQDEFAKRLYAKRNLKILRKFVRAGSLLEIGAGAGYFLDEARLSGFDVSGIELNGTQAEFIRKKMHIKCEDKPLHSHSFSAKKFDVVYHCDVISHFFDPVGEFRKINETLGAGGFVVFETGNGGDIDERYFKRIETFQYPDHLFFFSARNINSLLEMTGFKLLRTFSYSIVPQLFLLNFVAKTLGKQSTNGTANGSTARTVAPRRTAHMLVRTAKNIYAWCAYFLRYKIGYVAPKRGRPQTKMFVAKKL